MTRILTIGIIIGWAAMGLAGGWQTIQEDYLSGRISADKRADLALTLLTNPENLPQPYQISEPMKDATGMIVEIMSEKDRLNPDILERYSMTLARQNKQKQYDTPEGHFRIHYDTTGSHAVYQPTVDINPADGVPDYVNRTAQFCERAWTYECDTLHYDTPPYDGGSGGGTDLYDIYMHHYSGAYGVTWPESPSSQRPGRGNDYTSYIFVDPNYDGFGYSNRDLPMQVTSAHEFFHAVQFAYNSSAGSWFMENCATWMEDVIWDSVNDNYAYLSSFMNNTYMPLNTANGGFEYGAFIWPTYLQERYGFDLVRTVWEWTISSNAYVAVAQVLDEYAQGMEVAYPEFATWNYITGGRNDGLHYIEGGGYRQVRMMRTHTTYPINNNTSLNPPSTLGCNYVMFVRGSNHGRLRIQFNGANNGGWIVPVVKSLVSNQHEFGAITLDGNGDGELIISDFDRFSAVTMIPCALNGSSVNFTYTVFIDTATGIVDDPINEPSRFELTGNYPNPFNGQTLISFTAPAGYAGNAAIDIYDQLGRKIHSGGFTLSAGRNNLLLGADIFSTLSSGAYYYRIQFGDEKITGKMTYLK